jgi:hypothetical protein
VTAVSLMGCGWSVYFLEFLFDYLSNEDVVYGYIEISGIHFVSFDHVSVCTKSSSLCSVI